MSRATVLVIDDEKDLLELVRYNLEKEHLDVITAADGASGLEIGLKHKPDLVLLDLMMPGMNGLEVCKQFRGDARTSRVPIIMLTAKAAETDKIVGLEMGADDYITKPFSVRELLARVRAVLRRTSGAAEAAEVIRRGLLTIDIGRHEVSWDGQKVSLTATEFRILEYLANRPGRVLSRDDIIDGALARDSSVFNRTIDVHITALRKKLGGGGQHIETVRGFGYKWSDAAPEKQ
ncbi:MAG TPA: response regulator transcription factor [Tepidisphaeraceae bacterium]|nr:response regulator transcription factor [Tepidisphaeraceae bacterium]